MAKNASTSSDRPSHEEIARLAETIYEQSGRIPGRDMQNWLAAEDQIMAQRGNSAQPKPALKTPARTSLLTAQSYARKGNS